MSTLAAQFNATAISAETDDTMLRVILADGRELSVPLEWFPRLRDATAAQRAQWRLIGHGQGLHWPEIDEDISVDGLLRLR